MANGEQQYRSRDSGSITSRRPDIPAVVLPDTLSVPSDWPDIYSPPRTSPSHLVWSRHSALGDNLSSVGPPPEDVEDMPARSRSPQDERMLSVYEIKHAVVHQLSGATPTVCSSPSSSGQTHPALAPHSAQTASSSTTSQETSGSSTPFVSSSATSQRTSGSKGSFPSSLVDAASASSSTNPRRRARPGRSRLTPSSARQTSMFLHRRASLAVSLESELEDVFPEGLPSSPSIASFAYYGEAKHRQALAETDISATQADAMPTPGPPPASSSHPDGHARKKSLSSLSLNFFSRLGGSAAPSSRTSTKSLAELAKEAVEADPYPWNNPSTGKGVAGGGGKGRRRAVDPSLSRHDVVPEQRPSQEHGACSSCGRSESPRTPVAPPHEMSEAAAPRISEETTPSAPPIRALHIEPLDADEAYDVLDIRRASLPLALVPFSIDYTVDINLPPAGLDLPPSFFAQLGGLPSADNEQLQLQRTPALGHGEENESDVEDRSPRTPHTAAFASVERFEGRESLLGLVEEQSEVDHEGVEHRKLSADLARASTPPPKAPVVDLTDDLLELATLNLTPPAAKRRSHRASGVAHSPIGTPPPSSSRLHHDLAVDDARASAGLNLMAVTPSRRSKRTSGLAPSPRSSLRFSTDGVSVHNERLYESESPASRRTIGDRRWSANTFGGRRQSDGFTAGAGKVDLGFSSDMEASEVLSVYSQESIYTSPADSMARLPTLSRGLVPLRPSGNPMRNSAAFGA